MIRVAVVGRHNENNINELTSVCLCIRHLVKVAVEPRAAGQWFCSTLRNIVNIVKRFSLFDWLLKNVNKIPLVKS